MPRIWNPAKAVLVVAASNENAAPEAQSSNESVAVPAANDDHANAKPKRPQSNRAMVSFVVDIAVRFRIASLLTVSFLLLFLAASKKKKANAGASRAKHFVKICLVESCCC